MAARTHKVTLTDTWKDGVRASHIMKRLFDHALGENEMTATQIKAAQIVLGKIIPDLARTEVAGDAENPIAVTATFEAFTQVIENLKLSRQTKV